MFPVTDSLSPHSQPGISIFTTLFLSINGNAIEKGITGYTVSKTVKDLEASSMFPSFLEHRVHQVRPKPRRLLSMMNEVTHPRVTKIAL